jgi:hypothetical protein
MEDLGQLPHILLLTGIEILSTEINFGVDPVLNRKIDPLKKHGIRDINVDNSHSRIYLNFRF